MTATFGFTATFNAKPGRGDELVALLNAINTGDQPATDPNCVLFLVTRSASNPDQVYVIEAWTSAEAHKAATSTPQAKALSAELMALIDGEIAFGNDGVPQPGGKLLV